MPASNRHGEGDGPDPMMMGIVMTANELNEALWDIIHDELAFTGAWTIEAMLVRLPYGQQTRDVVRAMVRAGDLVRVARGVYRKY